MGFSEKRRFVRHLCPGIAVIPECSQACEAVERNPEWFNGTPVVMCGDFNSNAIWDENKTKNHCTQQTAAATGFTCIKTKVRGHI